MGLGIRDLAAFMPNQKIFHQHFYTTVFGTTSNNIVWNSAVYPP